jgi:Mg-chelatase subunit ChlD
LLLAVVIALLAFALVARVAQSREVPAADALPGATNLDVVLVIDQSGSMWDSNDRETRKPGGSVDVPSSRMVAANLLAEWLANDQSGAHHQLAVVMFGYEAKVVFPLQEIQSAQAQAAYKQALASGNQPMGGTNILEALTLAKAELDKGRSGPNNKKALIFLSDGVCEPLNNTTEAQRQQCEQDIRKLVQQEFAAQKSEPIFTIALTSGAFKQDPNNHIFKNLWQEISLTTGGDYYEPEQAGSALLDSFVKIMQSLFGLPMQSPPAPLDAPTTISMTLPNDLLQVGFTLIKYGQGISMTLTRPDGATVNPLDPSVRHSMSDWTETYNISAPPGGQWVATVAGSGKVVLLSIPFAQKRFSIERASPADAHPQGKPMDIAARVLDAGLTPQSVQAMQVQLQTPDGTTSTLPLLDSGAFYSATLQNTEALGAYVLNFSATLQGETFNTQQVVRVVTAPWLRVLEPQPGSVYSATASIPVRVQVMLDTKALDVPSMGDQLEAALRLLDANGQVADLQFLHPAGGGLYTGTLTAPSAGSYIARAQLTYRATNGEKFEDAAQVALAIAGAAPLVVQATSVPATPAPVATVPSSDPSPRFPISNFNLVLIALAALGVLILLSQWLLAGRLGSLRRALQSAFAQQDLAGRSRPGYDSSLHTLTALNWQQVTAQIIADALKRPITIDGAGGILDATANPCPRFSVVTCDGAEVIFTTDLPMLRQMKMVRRHDRIVDVSALSKARHVDAGMLWQYALAERGQVNAATPSAAHWYVVVRAPGARSAGLRALLRRRTPLQRLFHLRGEVHG